MICRLVAAALLVLLASGACAQSGAVASDLTGSRPNAGGEPDEITVRVGLLDIVGIDDREKLYMVDLLVEVTWQDPRLALSARDATSLRTIALSDIWTPRLIVVNNRGLDSLVPEIATIDSDGTVVTRLRLAGPLAVDLELHEFPFDIQQLPITIVSYQYTASEIVFSEDSELIARYDELSGDGWEYSYLAMERAVYRLKEDGRGGSGLTFTILAERDASFYLFTLALPMTLVLFLAWMTHWLPVELFPPRMGTASATVFSLIALGVSFRLTLPKITYLTYADRFVLFSTLLVIVSLAVTVITVRWVSTDRKYAAERLARQARIAFPLLYGGVVLLTFAS